MSNIIPAILAKNPEDLRHKLAEIPAEVELLHIDVLEEDVWIEEGIGRAFEVHLMLENPWDRVPMWVERGAQRLIVHKLVGKTPVSAEVGLGIEIHVPISEVTQDIESCDFVQLMSIAEIGKQGNTFDERIFDRIKEVKKHFPNVRIGVDGGVDLDNINALFQSGADWVVSGSKFQKIWNSQTAQ